MCGRLEIRTPNGSLAVSDRNKCNSVYDISSVYLPFILATFASNQNQKNNIKNINKDIIEYQFPLAVLAVR